MSDTYKAVTNAIVEAIEAGNTGAWKMPWHTNGDCNFSPINTASRKPYRGINTLCLWAAAQQKGYSSGEWGTYQQWQNRGAQVRKGEKSTAIVFWKFAGKEEKEGTGSESETESSSRLMFCKTYNVFNAAQVDGLPAAEETTEEAPVEDRIDSAEAFFAAVPAIVRHQGNRAFYAPGTDSITLPEFSAFNSPLDYYSTRAHETGHWTGTAARCDREMGKRFGDNAYAMEELVAELTAAFVMASLGLSSTPREDHQNYIASWLRVLKADSKAIFTAASKAQAAADYITAFAAQPVAIAA
jgi:antirestriction protein ArdC